MTKFQQVMSPKLNFVKLILSVFSFILILSLISTIKGQGEASFHNQKDDKAEEVFKLARQAVGKNIDTNNIKTLSAVFTGDYQSPKKEASSNNKVSYSFESKWQVEIPDKINVQKSISYETNQELDEIIINGGAITTSFKPILEGRTVQISISPENKQKRDAKSKVEYTRNAFVNFFPLLLRWNGETEFKFIGNVETKDGQASVLETIMPDKSRWQLFFDQKTHLLLLMVQTSLDGETNEKVELKYFFSDYKEDNGLFIPYKITSQQNGEVVQEQNLKMLKINPTFKSEIFEVKNQ